MDKIEEAFKNLGRTEKARFISQNIEYANAVAVSHYVKGYLFDVLQDVGDDNYVDNLEKYLQTSIFRSLIAEKYKGQIQSLYDSFYESGKDGLTQTEVENLRKQQQELADLGAVTPGALPHDAVVQLLRQADVYCLPTRYAEGFPTTLLEAAACRCPIVCTRTAGTEELLPDDTHGIVLPGQPQDATVETIRAGLQTLLDDPARAHACAEAAYRNVYAHFTWDAVFDKMMGIINQS